MKKVAVSVLCLLSILAPRAAAQSRSPGILPSEEGLTVTSITHVPDARIESSAVLSPELAAVPTACTPNATTYCANGNRFQVSIIFSAPNLGITNAPAQAVALTGDTGYFWFFSSNNVEVVVKVVDGRAFNNFYWVFEGALTDVDYTITVIDTQTGQIKTYHNTAGHIGSFADTAAFAGAASCSYSVAPPSQSFGSSGGSGSFTVTTSAGCSWTAASNAGHITITAGASGSGSGTVSFTVGANSSSSSRSGTLTIAGQTVTVTQAGVSTGGGPYDGVWTGTTNQTCQPSTGPAGPCAVTWTISNSNLQRFEIHYSGSACGIVDGGTTITYSAPGRQIDPASFNITSTGSPPIRADLNLNITKGTTSTATGTGSVAFTLSPPVGTCTTTNQLSFNAVKN
jgi:hypothetical protein